jgi:microcystin degradation protein MlrC
MGDALMSARNTMAPRQGGWRVGVASIVQETNTFSPRPSTLDDFRAQSFVEGEAAGRRYRGTNTELGGALDRLEARGAIAVPLIHAWAMSSGRLAREALDDLSAMLRRQIEAALPLDALVLSLHGALAAEGVDDADTVLARTARAALRPGVPLGVCLDLHANVTRELVESCDFLVGYHTYPHVDQADTGARTAALVMDALDGTRRPRSALARRPMLVPAEAQGADGPFGVLRAEADRATRGDVLDVSLFPVQPWLDVEDLGFAAVVTVDGDAEKARALATRFADLAWDARHDFSVELIDPVAALDFARRPEARRPVVLSESADSPTAGAPSDSPAMVRVLLEHGLGLTAYTTLVDAPAVAACTRAGQDQTVRLRVGCTIDARFHQPVDLQGVVSRIGEEPLRLTGPVFNGMAVSMGRYAVVRNGGLAVLLTERPACTFDPETYRHVGLPVERADVIVVRSATLFRAGFSGIAGDIKILDLPGASTPRLDSLAFVRAPRPLYPLEDW